MFTRIEASHVLFEDIPLSHEFVYHVLEVEKYFELHLSIWFLPVQPSLDRSWAHTNIFSNLFLPLSYHLKHNFEVCHWWIISIFKGLFFLLQPFWVLLLPLHLLQFLSYIVWKCHKDLSFFLQVLSVRRHIQYLR